MAVNRGIGARVISGLSALAIVIVVGYLGIWQWMFCRLEVPPGNSLMLRYKGPFPPLRSVPIAPEGTLVQLDDRGRPTSVGILEIMPGPGRHFYNPLEYESTLVEDTVIKPGEIGLVTSKVGKTLPAGSYLADEPGYKGLWRRVLTPGRYRMNTKYAFEIKRVGMGAAATTELPDHDLTLIKPGYVGVVTNLAGNKSTGESQGLQPDVLQPGIYFINPMEKRVDILSVGYNETTMKVTKDEAASIRVRVEAQKQATALAAASPGLPTGRAIADDVYQAGTGIEFPSSDGFLIHLDYTAIWGILPDQAPDVVRQFGGLKDVESKVILPQIGSICRLYGSKRGAVDLLVGDSREEFQTDTSEELERVLQAKKLSLLFGLTRHIYVPEAVREPMQKAKIADEMKLTRDQEQLTAKAQADLTEAKARVVLEERRTKAETLKMVAQAQAEGEKNAKEIEALTEKLKAEVDAKTAEINAKITTLMGEAEAKKIELSREAEAERFALYVQSLGTPEAYNRYTFAENLPTDIQLGIFHAGQGTFWTDMKSVQQAMFGKLVSESQATEAAGK